MTRQEAIDVLCKLSYEIDADCLRDDGVEPDDLQQWLEAAAAAGSVEKYREMVARDYMDLCKEDLQDEQYVNDLEPEHAEAIRVFMETEPKENGDGQSKR